MENSSCFQIFLGQIIQMKGEIEKGRNGSEDCSLLSVIPECTCIF